MGKHDMETLGYVADVIKRHLAPQEMVMLACMVILPADDDPVLSLNAKFDVEHGEVEVNHPSGFGLPQSTATSSLRVLPLELVVNLACDLSDHL